MNKVIINDIVITNRLTTPTKLIRDTFRICHTHKHMAVLQRQARTWDVQKNTVREREQVTE